jgi:hypothetical protein
MPPSQVETVVAELASSRAGVRGANARVALTAVRVGGAHSAVTSEADGYAVQKALSSRLEATLGRVVGTKIGCTTPVMQKYLGVSHPCSGRIYKKTLHKTPAMLRHRDYHRSVRMVCMHACMHSEIPCSRSAMSHWMLATGATPPLCGLLRITAVAQACMPHIYLTTTTYVPL